jgi:hypothetical protein
MQGVQEVNLIPVEDSMPRQVCFVGMSQASIAFAVFLLAIGTLSDRAIAQPLRTVGVLDPSFTAFRAAIYAGISEQIGTLPLPTGGGFTYRRDPELGVPTRTTDSFGPVFADRADTTGRGTFTLSTSYTRQDFDSLDGVSLDTGEISRTFMFTGVPPFMNTQPIVKFKEKVTADVFNVAALYGVTDHLDVGITIPFLRIEVRERASASNLPSTVLVPPLDAESTGLGDMVLRSKYNFWEWPEVWSGRLGIAASLDIRLPTGSKGQRAEFTSTNVFEYQQPTSGPTFHLGPGIGDPPLGTGIVRVRPLLIASGSWSVISPHVNLGMELGSTQGITNDLVYAVGLEYFPFGWVTFSTDLLGRYAFDVKRDRITQTGVGGGASPTTLTGSFGVKANPIRTLLVILNFLVPLNDTGLRADVVPTVGLEWTF